MEQQKKDFVSQLLRFALVGVFATLLHYALYWVLKQWINYNIAYTIGYALAFVANFFLSAAFTFKKSATVKKGVGFGGAHLFNYLLQLLLLNLVVWLGVSKDWAPLPVYLISIPVNFLMVRLVFTRK